MDQLLAIIILSSILIFVATAAMLTFRFAGFPDLSVDGVFTLGGVVFAKCLINGFGLFASLVVGASAGLVVGALTAMIADRFRINPLLASVLILTILYSVNLRVLGTANQPLYQYSDFPHLHGALYSFGLISLAIIIMLGAYLFFRTEMGSALRMTGSSPKFLIAVGRNISVYRAVLVSAAGVFVSLSGALLSFHLGFVDVAIGNGTIIVGIASLIIGEKICGRERLGAQIGSAAVGIVLYELAAGVALSLGISATDVKLATGIITISLLGLSKRDRDRFLS